MFRKVKTKLKKIYYAVIGTPKWALPSESPITYSFTWDGEDYYCFENPLNMPWQRSYVALGYYEEFNMRITKQMLLDILLVMKTEINNPRPGISEVVKYINILEERINYIVEPETLLKLASVYYFTKEESPVSYDLIYNNEKIKKWRKSNTLDFFLQLPFKELAPLGTLSPEVIQTYLAGQVGKSIKIIDKMLEVLLHKDCEPSKLKELQLQRNSLIELMLSISQS